MRKLLVFILLTLLQACASPLYQTFYSYDPPDTPEGKACIFQCENTRMQCEQLDDMRNNNCEQRAEMKYETCKQKAEIAYEKCKSSGGKYCIEGWCNKETCSSTNQCVNQYQRCYSTCGGRVTSETRCVAHCEK